MKLFLFLLIFRGTLASFLTSCSSRSTMPVTQKN